MNNKGFSVLEFIMLVAIMAVLTSVLVPALVGYVDKSRNNEDVIETVQPTEEREIVIVPNGKYTIEENDNQIIITIK
ncbi:MAG: hypothetical protein UIM53_02775 [Acutalibacteraceae bacterium]|nr:hypothetical protein [Acutalibacteraceae bacterium]